MLYDDSTVVKALTLQAAPSSLHHAARNAQPSARYLGLLQAGGWVRCCAVKTHHQSDVRHSHLTASVTLALLPTNQICRLLAGLATL